MAGDRAITRQKTRRRRELDRRCGTERNNDAKRSDIAASLHRLRLKSLPCRVTLKQCGIVSFYAASLEKLPRIMARCRRSKRCRRVWRIVAASSSSIAAALGRMRHRRQRCRVFSLGCGSAREDAAFSLAETPRECSLRHRVIGEAVFARRSSKFWPPVASQWPQRFEPPWPACSISFRPRVLQLSGLLDQGRGIPVR